MHFIKLRLWVDNKWQSGFDRFKNRKKTKIFTHPTGRYESSAWFTVRTASDSAKPLDSNDECTFIVSSTDEKSSSGFSPGKTKSFFIRLALHIPPKYASSHSNQFNVEFGNFICQKEILKIEFGIAIVTHLKAYHTSDGLS